MRWTDNLADELHKPVYRSFPKRCVYTDGVDKIWAADLVEMTAFSKFNKGNKYLLMVIDVFSKYGWIIPLKSKTGIEVANALKQIFKHRKPDKMWVDKGKEFYNKHVQALVELYSTENEEKSCVVERWNRTMKEKMWKYFSANSTHKYIDVLDDMLYDYNNKVHSSIKMTPTEASLNKNEHVVYRNLYDKADNRVTPIHFKFNVGDRVRIVKKKKTFEKGYTPRWTEEVFTISQQQHTRPPTYKIQDYNGEVIQGTFYEQEIQKTTQDIYRIEKVIKRKGNKVFVKWKGYPDDFNSWVDKSELIDL